MKNIVKGSVALVAVAVGALLVGSAFAPCQAKTTEPSVIELPEMVVAGEAARPSDDMVVELDGPVAFHPEKCAALLAQWGADADYRCPRSHRSAPTGRASHKGSVHGPARTYLHVLDQGGTHYEVNDHVIGASTVIVHDAEVGS